MTDTERARAGTPETDALTEEFAKACFEQTKGEVLEAAAKIVDHSRQLETELIEANEMIADADADCARHNVYTIEEGARAVAAICAAEKWSDSTYASWHDRIWWIEQMKEIARLRLQLSHCETANLQHRTDLGEAIYTLKLQQPCEDALRARADRAEAEVKRLTDKETID